MDNINERIVTLRKLFRKTQAELAKDLSVSEQVVSKWERGETVPSVADVTAISKYFGVSYDYIISGKVTDADRAVLSKKPSDEELLADAKANFIKQCNAVMKELNLYRYKDKIFPDEERDRYLKDDYHLLSEQGADKDRVVGIFIQVYQGTGQPFGLGVDLHKILLLDNYDVFEKFIKAGLPLYCEKYEGRHELRDFWRYDEFLSYKDVAGLTDIRFYELLADQDELIEGSLKRTKTTLKEYKTQNNVTPRIKRILNEALDKLDHAHPHYWKIVKILIEKGARIQKIVNVKYGNGEPGAYYSPLEIVYADDEFITQLMYERAVAQTNKK